MRSEMIELNAQELATINGGDAVTGLTFGGTVITGALVGSSAGPVGALVGAGGAALGFGIGCAINYFW